LLTTLIEVCEHPGGVRLLGTFLEFVGAFALHRTQVHFPFGYVPHECGAFLAQLVRIGVTQLRKHLTTALIHHGCPPQRYQGS
jgi:hypothetical protein